MKKSLLSLALLMPAAAFAAPNIIVGTDTVAAGATATVTVDYEGTGSTVVGAQFDLTPSAVGDIVSITPLVPDASAMGAPTDCTGGPVPVSFSVTVACSVNSGVVTYLFDDSGLKEIPDFSLGTIDYQISGAAAPGTVIDLNVTGEVYGDESAASIPGSGSTNGSVTVSGPAATVAPTPHDFGTVLVGTGGGTLSQTITVTSAGDQDLILNATAASLAGGALFSINDVDCNGATVTPTNTCTFNVVADTSAATANSDTYTVASNAADAIGTVDIVVVEDDAELQVTGSPVALSGTVGGASTAGGFTLSNIATAPVTEALNFSNCSLAGDAQINYLPGNLSTLNFLGIGVGASASSGDFACDTAASGSFTADLVCDTTDDDNASGITIGTINCDVTSAVYESNPTDVAHNTDFGDVSVNTSSAVENVDIANSAGVNQLDITNIAIAGDVAQFTLTTPGGTSFSKAAGEALDGTADFTVACTPDADGNFTATVTVNSNDGDHTYDYACAGVSTAVLSPSLADGATLTVGPGAGSTAASFTVSNTGDDSMDVLSCSLAGASTAAPDNCVLTTVPAIGMGLTLAPTDSMTVTVTCDLVEGTDTLFADEISCNFNGDFDGDNGTTPTIVSNTWSLRAFGAIFVIPTLSQFGLILMALVLLVMGVRQTRKV